MKLYSLRLLVDQNTPLINRLIEHLLSTYKLNEFITLFDKKCTDADNTKCIYELNDILVDVICSDEFIDKFEILEDFINQLIDLSKCLTPEILFNICMVFLWYLQQIHKNGWTDYLIDVPLYVEAEEEFKSLTDTSLGVIIKLIQGHIIKHMEKMLGMPRGMLLEMMAKLSPKISIEYEQKVMEFLEIKNNQIIEL
jgi:hypothetical protein